MAALLTEGAEGVAIRGAPEMGLRGSGRLAPFTSISLLGRKLQERSAKRDVLRGGPSEGKAATRDMSRAAGSGLGGLRVLVWVDVRAGRGGRSGT